MTDIQSNLETMEIVYKKNPTTTDPCSLHAHKWIYRLGPARPVIDEYGRPSESRELIPLQRICLVSNHE